MNKRERSRCLKRRRKKAVRRWNAVRKSRQGGKGKKARFSALMLTFVCVCLETASSKGWQPGNSTAEIRIDRLPTLIEIRPFYEEGLQRREEAVRRTEQGISLFLKEGRVVFFRIQEKAFDH